MTSKQQSWGDYFGYPKCCIRSFHIILRTDTKWNMLSQERQQTTTNGFVPCQQCAERILRGEIHVHELILPTRQCPKPFIRI